MPHTSYTRNFEDVMLRRAFAGVPRGFYVDVGAFHPSVDSNSYALYELGWRGIAVEPQTAFNPAWAQARPEDILINAAAGDAPGEQVLYYIPAFGQGATTVPALADSYRQRGLEVIEHRVPVMTLDTVLQRHRPGGDIHCLSIDVEGAERSVLRGLDRARFRPWLIVLESTLPGSPRTNHAEWEPLLLETHYEFVYFDAVNRFYLAREHLDLKVHFDHPPCVWDDFVSFDLVQAQRQAQVAQAQVGRIRLQLQQLLNEKQGHAAQAQLAHIRRQLERLISSS